MMNKYNIGDKVLIRGDLYPDGIYGEELFVDSMVDFRDKIVTITEVHKAYNGSGQFRYGINNCNYVWSEEMFVRKIDTSEDKFWQNGGGINMPEIVNYTYNPETGETYIKWSDKSETTVVAENPETADQYVGFVTAYAKKAAGNTSHITGLFEKWAIKKPAQELKKQILNNNKLLEEKSVAEKRKAKKEQWLILKEARRLKREYEAKKLANEKYGVPMDEDK